jgi:hypothetical protein
MQQIKFDVIPVGIYVYTDRTEGIDELRSHVPGSNVLAKVGVTSPELVGL